LRDASRSIQFVIDGIIVVGVGARAGKIEPDCSKFVGEPVQLLASVQFVVALTQERPPIVRWRLIRKTRPKRKQPAPKQMARVRGC